MSQAKRERNILDDGIYPRQEVFIDLEGVHGQIIGVDFERGMIQIEVNVPACRVKPVPNEENTKVPYAK